MRNYYFIPLFYSWAISSYPPPHPPFPLHVLYWWLWISRGRPNLSHNESKQNSTNAHTQTPDNNDFWILSTQAHIAIPGDTHIFPYFVALMASNATSRSYSYHDYDLRAAGNLSGLQTIWLAHRCRISPKHSREQFPTCDWNISKHTHIVFRTLQRHNKIIPWPPAEKNMPQYNPSARHQTARL